MPDARLQRTRENYRFRCGHKNKLVDETRVVTDEHGVSHVERIPQRFTVGRHDRFCLGCGQVVNEQDDLAADIEGWGV